MNHRDTETQRHRDTENEERDPLTRQIIGAAMEVHRILGPGLLERIYERALCIELEARGRKYARQLEVPAYYKGWPLGTYYVDLLVEDLVVVEVKSVINVAPVIEAQLITYMRLTKKRRGLILNFHSPVLKDGITRRVL
jgi:GxxExxY protein